MENANCTADNIFVLTEQLLFFARVAHFMGYSFQKYQKNKEYSRVSITILRV